MPYNRSICSKLLCGKTSMEEIVSIRGLIEGPWQFVVILTRLDMYQKRGEEMYHENNRVAGVL